MEENKTVITAQKLKKYFPIKKGIFSIDKKNVKAVDEVDFYIKKGETFGLVGESGCGKTTLGMGLNEQHLYRFPHEFSGGQKQRIGIARALALNPDFIILDEPTSALDVSVQAQILNLLKDLQKKLGLTYLFITHDLSVIKYISNRVGVMYAGKIVEIGETDEIFKHMLHPYTVALLSAIPVPDVKVKREHKHLKGEVPSLVDPPSGCRFHPRCEKCKPICSRIEPDLKEINTGHFVACHLY